MKRIILQTVLLLMSGVVFAQEVDENYQKGYNFGKKYGWFIIAGLIIIIVLIIMRVMKKKGPPKA